MSPYKPRDTALENELVTTACRAAGLPDDRGLREFADRRAWKRGVRVTADWDQEAAEEIADCSSYLLWGCIEAYPGYLAGEPVDAARFERRLRALRRQVESWHDLMTEAH